ncbi:MAG: hypothetical protein RIR25_1351 [Verrucomicrobiota bacterium]|jgi:hypothetical protein
MKISKILTAGPASPVRALVLTAIISSCAFTSKVAAEEVITPVQDAFVLGGNVAGELMSQNQLQVASRVNARKTFLQFQVDESLLRDAASARVVLTMLGSSVISSAGESIQPVELALSGAPGAQWDEKLLTWENAPLHDQQSTTDEGNPRLEVLALAKVDPATAKADEKVTFSDPRLLEFLRKHQGDVTFVITSVSPRKSAGLKFFSKEGTAKPERRPALILGKK